MPMKPGIDVKVRRRPNGPWAGVTGRRGEPGRVGSAALPSPDWTRRPRSTTQKHRAVHVTRRFRAPAERVFGAWFDPEIAGRWLFATATRPMTHVEIDARIGGSFRFVDRRSGAIAAYTGEYLEIAPHRRVVFTLAIEPTSQAITRVNVEIEPLTKGCELTLRHEDVPQDQASYIECRWIGILYGLGATLDSCPEVSTASRSEP
jgi:uncharacterized protein YndB with AHSA1/START domain